MVAVDFGILSNNVRLLYIQVVCLTLYTLLQTTYLESSKHRKPTILSQCRLLNGVEAY